MPNRSRRRDRSRQKSWWLSSEFLTLSGIAIVILLCLAQYLSPQATQKRQARLRVRLAELQQQEIGIKQATEEGTAKDRYESACLIPWAEVDEKGYGVSVIALAEGMTIYDFFSGLPIADGQKVCDDRNMTFEIVNGKTANGARTSDSKLVNRRFRDSARWNQNARRSTVMGAAK